MSAASASDRPEPPALPNAPRGQARGSLGRGLDSLLPAAAESSGAALEVPLDAIDPNPDQPRRGFDAEGLESLAASIREHGIVQPLVVQPRSAGRYQLIAGERRWRAAQFAGLSTVPVIVSEAPSEDRLTLALVENLQREDLNPIEAAQAFAELVDRGWNHRQIGERIGKSRSAVANQIRLLQLPDTLQQQVVAGTLSEGHARALLLAPESEREQLAETAISEALSVRALEDRARGETEAAAEARPALPKPLSEDFAPLAKQLSEALDTRVLVRRGARGGRIVIHWDDLRQVEELLRRLRG